MAKLTKKTYDLLYMYVIHFLDIEKIIHTRRGSRKQKNSLQSSTEDHYLYGPIERRKARKTVKTKMDLEAKKI